jgi:CheY-like chemotaxis protein
MANEVIILIADDDAGHCRLVEKHLRRAGLNNPILQFSDVLGKSGLPAFDPSRSHLLLLDIRMPKVDGVEVLRRIKTHPVYRKMPICMLTTTDDPREVERCHELGCNHYLVKPVDYGKFAESITRLGMFITLMQIPGLDSVARSVEAP